MVNIELIKECQDVDYRIKKYGGKIIDCTVSINEKQQDAIVHTGGWPEFNNYDKFIEYLKLNGYTFF